MPALVTLLPMITRETVFKALLDRRGLSAADLACELADRDISLSRQQAWRILNGARRATPELIPRLDEILALGSPKLEAELAEKRPLYAIARLQEEDFRFLFLLGGGQGHTGRLPLFRIRGIAEEATRVIAKEVPDAVTVPTWATYALAHAARRSGEKPSPDSILLVEAGAARGGALTAESLQLLFVQLCPGLVDYALLTDTELLEEAAAAALELHGGGPA